MEILCCFRVLAPGSKRFEKSKAIPQNTICVKDTPVCVCGCVCVCVCGCVCVCVCVCVCLECCNQSPATAVLSLPPSLVGFQNVAARFVTPARSVTKVTKCVEFDALPARFVTPGTFCHVPKGALAARFVMPSPVPL